jgi:hydrogenase maturation protease
VAAPSLLVVGLGNLLLSDEGIGVHVVRALAERYRLPPAVELIDGGTSGMDLLDALAQAERVIVVDAARTGRAPGTVLEVGDGELPAFFSQRLSPHQVGFGDVLASLALIGARPREIVLVAIEPEDLSLGVELSACGREAAALALAAVLRRLAAWGCAAEPASGPLRREESEAWATCA